MIAGPGRIRAIIDGVWQHSGESQSFALVEIGVTGLTVLTEDRCAAGAHVSSLGRTKSGETALLCQDLDSVQFGVFDEEHGRMAWRWKQALDRTSIVRTTEHGMPTPTARASFVNH